MHLSLNRARQLQRVMDWRVPWHGLQGREHKVLYWICSHYLLHCDLNMHCWVWRLLPFVSQWDYLCDGSVSHWACSLLLVDGRNHETLNCQVAGPAFHWEARTDLRILRLYRAGKREYHVAKGEVLAVWRVVGDFLYEWHQACAVIRRLLQEPQAKTLKHFNVLHLEKILQKV